MSAGGKSAIKTSKDLTLEKLGSQKVILAFFLKEQIYLDALLLN